MYLKSLEIQGFKSFAEKTVLTFDNDITAIVGPNGSGKSNISDAIRWVMGEQSSKSLRGSKMEDVIFGGTQKRAQLGFAEVTLILDNSDHALSYDGAEIMVTRRYYRSGESEYYINKQSVRLKDITELFMNTGLGREGYSNIGQGRIDEILSVKSTDRREIFEEAAGIARYRHRKEDTERRLAATEENLTRIGDKISELELQLEPLRRQAEQAKKYLALKDELKGLEVTVWLDSLEKLSEAAKKAAEDFAASSKQLEDAHGELNRLYQLSEQLALTLHTKDLALDELRLSISEAEAEEQRRSGEKTILENNLLNSRENIERIHSELDDQASRTGSLRSQIEERQQRINEILQSMGAMEAKLQLIGEKSGELLESTDAITLKLLQERTHQAELLRISAERSAERASLEQLRSELSDRLEQLKNDESVSEARLAQLQEQSAQLNEKLKALRAEATDAQNRIDGFTLRLKARTEKRDALQQQVHSLQVELDTAQSRIKMYREMERNYEGFSGAVREVMQETARGGLRGIHGPLSRLIHVEPEYTTAIETALGAAMQNIVVDAEEDGRSAISYLKRRELGRCTFLPLTSIRGRTLQESGLEACAGFLGLASELVQTKDTYRAVVMDQLGRTAVTDTLDHAIAMARKYHNRFRIVTLDGQVMNAGGSMTGGSAARSSGVLARDNALQELLKKQEKIQKQLDGLSGQLQEAVRLAAETEFESTAAQEQLRQTQDAVLRLEGDCRQVETLLALALEAKDSGVAEQDALRSRMEDSEHQLAAADERRRKLDAELLAAETQIAGLEQESAELSQQNEAVTAQMTELRMSAAALEAEHSACDATIAQLRELQTSLQGDRAQREALLKQYESDAAQAEQLIAASEEAIEAARLLTKQRRESLALAMEERRTIEEEKTASDKQTQETNKQILLLERETARLEQRKTTSELEQNQIVDRLWDNYGLTNSTAQEQRVEIDSIPEANRKIASLKQRISSLGTPNLGAIEEFDRVGERHSYLTGQRDDVLTSRKDLESIIQNITSEMTVIFVEQFRRINETFGSIFTEMFGGGKASLELEDAEHPLDCGIEIRVQPPGKQLKTITLLSGGEKAFVAIALYFAILRVHPTPFCMLDEIDAALDERNVARFASYLRNLCKNTQFIVITHRRGTMEACDVLYGVTMQEQGVSRMLSIHLNELQTELGIE